MLWLTTQHLPPTVELFSTAIRPAWSTHEDTITLPGIDLPFITTFGVHRTAAAAQPIKPAPGLLSSTDPAFGISPIVESKFAAALAPAGQEWFEDGIESEFSRALSTLIFAYGHAAIAAVETFLASRTANIEVAVEAAQWLGKVDHPSSYQYRKTLLEKLLLTARSPRLRHGAAAGLATMDDPSSLAMLVEARNRESNRRLAHFLQLVVDQLERTRVCRNS